MQGKVVEVATGRKVLLFDEEDLQDTIKVRRDTSVVAARDMVCVIRDITYMVLVRAMLHA